MSLTDLDEIRARVARKQDRRTRLDSARRAGLARRHAVKLQRTKEPDADRG